MKWKKLRSKIPNKTKIDGKIFYEILFSKDLGDAVGVTDFDKKQIVIKLDLSDKETVLTYFHEILHAISYEQEIDLTETQVRKLEQTFTLLNNLFDTLKGT